MDKDTKQLSLLDEHKQAGNGHVVCLGMTFENDEARREYFRNELRKQLPDLKGIEGFPIGEDEDIIALSDPPYYTACPNPWINDFIEEWEPEKIEKYDIDGHEEYHREPFVADVSEGKNDPIYKAHSYHTKVPPKAIMRYILHYTDPGDFVFDGFCGTGMMGIAAQMCGDRNKVMELGYQVKPDGTIMKEENNEEGKAVWKPYSKLGVRRAFLNDLSPVASFIAYNYNTPVDAQTFEKEAKGILSEVEKELGWMYETRHSDGRKGKINYTVWSDVFVCPECINEFVYWDVAVDKEAAIVFKEFSCPNCDVKLTKRNVDHAWISKYDHYVGETIRQAKQVPVLINYTVDGKRAEKRPDEYDFQVIGKIDNSEIPFWFPTNRMIEGKESRRNDPVGITHIHHFYTKRNLWIISAFYKSIHSKPVDERILKYLKIWFTSSQSRLHIMNRYAAQHKRHVGPMANTLYISSTPTEISPFYFFNLKVKENTIDANLLRQNVFQIGSCSDVRILNESLDYVFIDPPFGANINYSELSFLWESWLKVSTNNKMEAIENSVQGKGLNEYRQLMIDCFKEAYRVLKPGRWMTVEFSNTKASVWNSIQAAISEAGFVVANVAALDKGRGGLHAIIGPTAVKQDLVISAYKPKKENIEKMKGEQNTEESAWIFVTQHLEQLPVFLGIKGEAQVISERTPRILFDRMVAYHVQNGLTVPISSVEFQASVAQRFPMRDGMAFLERQVAEYDKKRTLVKEFAQMSLFVSDENSAIEWIRQQLLKKPQTRQDLHPNYMKEIQHIAKHELLPELDDLLYQNFLCYEGDGVLPDQIAAYLRRNYKDLRGLEVTDAALIEKAMNRWYVPDPNKQADLEKLREKSLLREFEGYLEELEKSKKKLKQFRTEAIRVGFKKAYSEKDFEKIVKVGDRLPETIIQEDDKLLMYYDNACIRLGL
ncbi:site-specific DNA-methyltransferase [Bacillus cereus]|uniref:site-specific DNA-methyltransferase n=1 Tax=Bacillus cereus TaxID=1396 RepID=UPI00211D27BF|nr:site-specific DNA-methyltransferase [Bacillus cereus]